MNKVSRHRRHARHLIFTLGAAVAATELPAPALTIKATFDSTVTSLSYATQFEDAFNDAAHQYDDLYSNPITVNITVSATNTTNYLGDTSDTMDSTSYSALRTAFLANAASTGQADQMTAAANEWPSTDPMGSGVDWYVPRAEAKALGIVSGSSTATDATISFSTAYSYPFDPLDRRVPGESDFMGVAEHEIGHALDRVALTGSLDSLSKPSYAPLDLYRFLSPGTLAYTAASGVYFSIDGGTTNLRNFATPSSDSSDWSGNVTPPDSYNNYSGAGYAGTLSPQDITLNGVMGYNENPGSLTWNGGNVDFLTGNGWSSSTQPSVNPHSGVGMTVNGGTPFHNFKSGENFELSDVSSDMGTSLTITNGTFSLGVSGTATTNGFGLLVNQDGVLTVENNGTLEVAGPISVGDGDNNTVTNASALFEGNALVYAGTASGTTQQLIVGNNGAGTVDQIGNAFVSAPYLNIGNNASANGTYGILFAGSASLFITSDAYIGNYGTGNLTQAGGNVTIDGTVYIGSQTGANGTVDLSSGTMYAGNEAVGYFGKGAVSQTGGTQNIAGFLHIGGQASANGSYTLSGSTSLTVGGNEIIAPNGQGTFAQSAGSTHTIDGFLEMGQNSGALGIYDISDTGSTLNVYGSMYLGGSSSAAGGTGTFFLKGGQVAVSNTLIIWDTYLSALSVTGGSFTTASTVNDNLIQQTGGTTNMGPVSGTGQISVGNSSGATATMTVSALTQNSLTIESTGSVLLLSGAPNNTLDSLSISGAGKLNIYNGHIFIDYAGSADPIASIAAWIKSGYNAGAWDGAGIYSTAAAANSLSYGLGYADSADPGNPAGLPSGTIEIKYTLLGDANLDGVVDGTDFGILAANFNKGVTGWDQGDFNYDNVVDGSDFADLASNFNKGASGADVGPPAIDDPAIVAFAQANGLMADLPEPMAASSILCVGSGLFLRRRRKR